MELPIVIAGAGIGGLTAALALHRVGVDVHVLESAHHLRPLGVGINLLPHAVRELRGLGLGEALDAIAVAPTVIAYHRGDGIVLFREPRGLAAGDAHPQLSVHRGRLQMLLRDAVRERLGARGLTTGAAVTGFAPGPDAVAVHTRSGSVTGAALIGADGIGSAVRAILHPEDGPLVSAGITMYRGASRIDAFLDGRTMAIISGANGVDTVVYPIGDGLVNWVVQVPDGSAGPLTGTATWNAEAGAADVLPHLDDWTLDWLDAEHLVGNTDEIFSYPMVDKDALPHWGSGRVTLLGDAAHPMYPVGANGGSQAVVDARVLADHVAAHGVAGLRHYERERRIETADVIAANRKMHWETTARAPNRIADITRGYRTDTLRSTRS